MYSMKKFLGISSVMTLICMIFVVVWTACVPNSDDNSLKIVGMLELGERCLEVQAFDNRQSINPRCMPELDLMFYEKPVWKFFNIPVFEASAGGGFYVPGLDRKRRGRSLGFSVEDYFGTDFPTFDLIFDNRYHERQDKTFRSLFNWQCTDISHNWGTDQTFTQHCDARTLIIYAITLDVCATAFKRYRNSHSKHFPNTPSNFQSGVKRLEKGWVKRTDNRSNDHPDDDGYSFIQGNLWTVWTLHKCSESSYAYLGFDLDYLNLFRSGNRDSEELKKLTGINLQPSATELENLVNPLTT